MEAPLTHTRKELAHSSVGSRRRAGSANLTPLPNHENAEGMVRDLRIASEGLGASTLSLGRGNKAFARSCHPMRM